MLRTPEGQAHANGKPLQLAGGMPKPGIIGDLVRQDVIQATFQSSHKFIVMYFDTQTLLE